MKLYKLFALASAAAVTLSMASCSDRSEKYQDYEPGNRRAELNPVMETDKGYYAKRRDASGENMLEICYYDKESGKAIYLCSKPECSHDGGEFCTATHKDINAVDITMSDGYIYIKGAVISEEEDMLTWKLYRANADGTQFTEICSYQKLKTIFSGRGPMNYSNDLIVHRGYAIVEFNDHELSSPLYDYMPNIMMIDLESGHYKTLPTADYDLTKTQRGRGGLYIEDDYLYYYIEPQNYTNTKYLYRYNLVTGETERIGTNTRLHDFVVMDGVVYYTTVPTDEQEYVPFYAYDTATGKETDLSQNLNSAFGAEHHNVSLMCDGRYIYFVTSIYNGERGQTFLMLSEDMKRLISIEPPQEIREYGTELKISNEKAYFVAGIRYRNDAVSLIELGWETNTLAYSCPVEDIATGNPEWTLAYDFTEFEESLMEDIKDETE